MKEILRGYNFGVRSPTCSLECSFEMIWLRNIQNDFKTSLLHLAIAKPNYTAVSILVNQENIDLDVSFFYFII